MHFNLNNYIFSPTAPPALLLLPRRLPADAVRGQGQGQGQSRERGHRRTEGDLEGPGPDLGAESEFCGKLSEFKNLNFEF